MFIFWNNRVCFFFSFLFVRGVLDVSIFFFLFILETSDRIVCRAISKETCLISLSFDALGRFQEPRCQSRSLHKGRTFAGLLGPQSTQHA
uniref:Uncharacterized protein n=1 Tax=Oryza brachyantha TaxID=4533 RepID=J3M791_ORYBR